ncbi:glycoside hydrolase family 127 protein [Bacteroidota bacterium]
MKRIVWILYCFQIITLISTSSLYAQQNAIVNTSNSPYAKLTGVDIDDVQWTEGFWAERFEVCKNSMVPHMMANYMDSATSHAFRNFEIAAGLKKGSHMGPPFHDGDFYKMLEGLIMIYAATNDPSIDKQLDSIIKIIAQTQRKDGYIHTPVVIEQLNNEKNKKEFAERLDFETYNMGHLMTAACIHNRVTGKTSLLNIAIKATDFLYNYYQQFPLELAQNAICPSHYMGVTEMYRITNDSRYLELAKGLIDIRSEVENGTDHNQDRIPFRRQTKAIGHAVRANYLYAGAADVYAEIGDDSLMNALTSIWQDLVETKLYITSGCGALYDGVSPEGTSYKPSEIQQVHQAYGRDFELPNITAHNESCANIGNMLWNWRMLQITGEAKYADIMELTMYNSLLAGVSLDGKGYFYTNPLCVNDEITYNLRWSKEREEYISYCNCCPPNTIRTVAEIHNYFYSISDNGLRVNFYGGNKLTTNLKDGSVLKLTQKTDYPWDGKIEIILEQAPNKEFSIFLRIPGWCKNVTLTVNKKSKEIELISGSYAEIKRKWKSSDKIELSFLMEPMLIEANPLVEETRNQVAIKRGPVVYCIESVDIPDSVDIFNITIPSNIDLRTKNINIENSDIISLEGEARLTKHADWTNHLYREIPSQEPTPINIRLIPYYAWGNRGQSEMTVWLPLGR